MRALDILEAIGEIDERDIAIAHAKKSRKPLYVGLGSLAACLVAVFLLPGIVMNLIGFGAADAPGDMAPDREDGATDISAVISAKVIGADNTSYDIDDSEALAELKAFLGDVIRSQEGSRADLPHAGDALAQGELRLILTDEQGRRAEYLLREKSLLSYETSLEYTLSQDRAEALLEILER